MKTPEDVRAFLEKRLRREVPEAVWTLLLRDYYVGEVLESDSPHERKRALDALLERTRDLLALVGGGRRAPARQRIASPREERADSLAFSSLCAVEATFDTRVLAFRRRYLPNGLIPLDSLWEWLEQHRTHEGEWEPVAETEETHRIFISFRVAQEKRILFGHPSNPCLLQLWALAQDLAARYNWTTEDAVQFILCGITPPVGVRAELQLGSVPCIVLTIPAWTPPTQVERIFRRVRSRIWKNRRSRPFTPRQADAIVRACQHLLHHPAATWEEVAVNVGVKKSLLQLWWTRARQKLRRWRSPAGSSAPDAEAP